jgi:uncharacterized protein (DUF1810 family)
MNKRTEYDFSNFKKKIKSEGNAALNEVKSGQKVSHWMWYFFPQLEGLGKSDASKYYGIKSLNEAKVFIQDKELQSFLVEITLNIAEHLSNKTRTITQIFGPIDKHKFLSSITLFYYAAKSLKNKDLKKFFKYCKKKAESELGNKDKKTISIIKKIEYM